MTDIVTITSDEAIAISTSASLQMIRAIKNGWVGKDHGGESKRSIAERWGQSILGMMAEYAVCKRLNRCWTASVDGIKGSDAHGIEVRTTEWETGKLIIYESDLKEHSSHPFVLVTGSFPTFTIRGWIKAEDAALKQWFNEDAKPASYWVPQSFLRPISELL